MIKTSQSEDESSVAPDAGGERLDGRESEDR